ncbi:MAG TPA: thiamine pyrophosphate-dependent enzyme [Dehalococcoidia bacterium]|nr:thiamine pyrophosphate-dependent enzyme [Dehalococcoidia bacterium]
MNRAEAVGAVLDALDEHDYLISTTGLISREVFAQGDRTRNFYMLGSMGLASALALGVALLRPNARVVVLEGDGSAMMALGTLPLVAAERPANLTHVVLDNEAYESTGAQPSISDRVDLGSIGEASGYMRVNRVSSVDGMTAALPAGSPAGPALVVAKVVLDPLLRVPPRVSLTPQQIKARFQAALAENTVAVNEA